MALQKISKVILFSVRFPTSERTSGNPIYFTERGHAESCASLKRGWYGSTGTVVDMEFKEDDLPKYYDSLDDWGKDTLTYNEYMEMTDTRL